MNQAPDPDALPDDELEIDLQDVAEESWEAGILREHAELAMTLCRRIVQQAEDANWLGMCGDTAFARVSHAMQVSIALKRKLETEAAAERRRAEAALATERAERARETAKAAQDEAVQQVTRAVEAIIEAPEAKLDRLAKLRLRSRLAIRLQTLDVTKELEGRTFEELVSGICAELGVAPANPVIVRTAAEKKAADRSPEQKAEAARMAAEKAATETAGTPMECQAPADPLMAELARRLDARMGSPLPEAQVMKDLAAQCMTAPTPRPQPGQGPPPA